MVTKNQVVPDATMLKLVAKLLKDNKSTRKFKVHSKNVERVVTYDDLVQFVDELAKKLDSGSYGAIRRCKTCGNFSSPGQKGRKGYCRPDEGNQYKSCSDYCSGWKPMTQEQRRTREIMYERFETLQTK